MKSECALWEGGDWCSVSAPLEWFGVSPHTGKLFTLLRSSLARERNSVIHHLYFYRQFQLLLQFSYFMAGRCS